MIKDKIKKANNVQNRITPEDSYFVATFLDGSEVTEKEYNWSSFSVMEKVEYLGKYKIVMKSIYPISKIQIFHGELNAEIIVPEGGEVYQAIRGLTMMKDHAGRNSIIGRIVGIIKNGEVVEEKIINIPEQIVQGWKK